MVFRQRGQAVLQTKKRIAVGVLAVGIVQGVASLPLSPAMAQTEETPASPAAMASAYGIIASIEVNGAQRVEAETVKSYMTVRVGEPFDPSQIDASLKNLFGTGLFADVTMSRTANTLIVTVRENPSINEVAFEGNKRFKDEDLAREIQSKERSVYTRTTVQSDLQRVLELYRRSGYFSATVVPKLIELDQNRVNLVFEVNEGERTLVRGISFVGNTVYSDGKLGEEVLTRPTRWYRFLSSSDVYDPNRVEVDKELLRRFYLSQGYADFRVVSGVAELSPDGKGFYITYTIEEGERYTFGDIDLKTRLTRLDPESLRNYLTTRKGEWYNADEVEATINALVDTLNDRQYAFVDIRPEVVRNRETKTINLTYTINEGQRVYVERININGNMRTQDRVIRREMMLVEGDPFNRSKLKLSEQHIKDLGFFEKVDVKVAQGSAPDRAVIDIDVREQSTGEVSVGAGYSTTDGPLADFGISERNFLGKGQTLRFSTTMSGRSQQFNFGFTEPYFLGRDLSAGFDLFHDTRENDESSFDEQQTGFVLRAGFPLSENLRERVSYTLKNSRIENVESTASRFIRDQEGERLTSMVGQELTYDRRDSRLTPTDGYVLRLGTDLAGLGGDAQYIRVKGGGAYYYPISGDQWVFSLMGEAGTIYGLDQEISIADRFFIGGDTLRGFETAGIGPRDLTTSAQDALGGNYFYRGSIELAFPLGTPEEMGLKGYAFTDAGSLWGAEDDPLPSETFVDEKSVRVSAGVGVSWRSPLGPLRVDVAYPIMKEDFDQVQQFRLSFGTRF